MITVGEAEGILKFNEQNRGENGLSDVTSVCRPAAV